MVRIRLYVGVLGPPAQVGSVLILWCPQLPQRLRSQLRLRSFLGVVTNAVPHLVPVPVVRRRRRGITKKLAIGAAQRTGVRLSNEPNALLQKQSSSWRPTKTRNRRHTNVANVVWRRMERKPSLARAFPLRDGPLEAAEKNREDEGRSSATQSRLVNGASVHQQPQNATPCYRVTPPASVGRTASHRKKKMRVMMIILLFFPTTVTMEWRGELHWKIGI
jgi:hypothetical protein